jgi:hypothetical protein
LRILTVVDGAGTGGRAVPGGLGGEPAGAVGGGKGGCVVLLLGADACGAKHGQDCHKRNGLGGERGHPPLSVLVAAGLGPCCGQGELASTLGGCLPCLMV